MSKLVHNYSSNGGSTTDEYGTHLVLNRLLTGDVVEGFAVAANSSPNMTVYVQPGSGRITTGTYPSSYGYLVSHDTGSQGEAVTIATASGSNPRIDYVVAYVDKGVAGSTSPTYVNNTNNVLKFASVAGTPAGSPVVPTTTQINTAIGASNPYIILAQIAVGTSVTQINSGNITDKRTFAYSRLAPGTILGYTQITSNFATTSTTAVQITGLTLTVTVPAGAHYIEITAFAGTIYNSASNTQAVLTIWDGAVGSGTLLNFGRGFQSGGSGATTTTLLAVVSPSAGTKTYNVGLHSPNAGTSTSEASSTQPSFMMVKAY